jgi:hypothetical protein
MPADGYCGHHCFGMNEMAGTRRRSKAQTRICEVDPMLTPPFGSRIQRFARPTLNILSVVYHI